MPRNTEIFILTQDKNPAFPIGGSEASKVTVPPAKEKPKGNRYNAKDYKMEHPAEVMTPEKELLKKIDELIKQKTDEGVPLKYAYDVVIAEVLREQQEANVKKKEYEIKIKHSLVFKEKERYKQRTKECEILLLMLSAERNGSMKLGTQTKEVTTKEVTTKEREVLSIEIGADDFTVLKN